MAEQLNRKDQQTSEATSINLWWRDVKTGPLKTFRQSDAVVDGNIAYFRESYSREIYAYDVTSDIWSQLLDCITEHCPITVISGWLTTIGGCSDGINYSNELFSLIGEGSNRLWTKKFPPMPTKRCWTSALCTGGMLIVAGGQGVDSKVLSTVEVMNIENYQWSTAADLPEPMYMASATVCGDCIYMLGGINKKYTNSAYTCSLSALIQSLEPCSLGAQLKTTSLEDKANAISWRKVADVPVTRSTSASLYGRLLAIGGEYKETDSYTTAVYVYHSTTNSWKIVIHLTACRCACLTAVLPDNQLMVVGGIDNSQNKSDRVEFATRHV